MAATHQSEARLDFRLPASQKAAIERAARVQNRTVTEFATTVLAEAAQRVLDEQEREAHVTLSRRDTERFLAMLDRKPSPNRALRNAAKRYRQLIVKDEG